MQIKLIDYYHNEIEKLQAKLDSICWCYHTQTIEITQQQYTDIINELVKRILLIRKVINVSIV